LSPRFHCSKSTDRNLSTLTPIALGLALMLCMPNVVSGQVENQAEAPIAGLPKGWLNSMRKRSASYVEFADASFTLDEGQLGLLRIELDNRISDQWGLERDMIDNPPPDPKDGSEADYKRYAQAINEAYERMPLNPERVADWVTNTIAAPGEANEGRSRFLELCERLDLLNKSTVTIAENKVKLSRLFKSGRARNLRFSHDGELVPEWQIQLVELPQGLLIHPNQEFKNGAVNLARVRDDLPPPLPCMVQAELWADWSAKNGQAANAGIFKLFQEFQFKTWWVLASENELYKAVSRADRNSIIAQAIDDAGLRPQIDALVHELRCRVEAAAMN